MSGEVWVGKGWEDVCVVWVAAGLVGNVMVESFTTNVR